MDRVATAPKQRRDSQRSHQPQLRLPGNPLLQQGDSRPPSPARAWGTGSRTSKPPCWDAHPFAWRAGRAVTSGVALGEARRAHCDVARPSESRPVRVAFRSGAHAAQTHGPPLPHTRRTPSRRPQRGDVTRGRQPLLQRDPRGDRERTGRWTRARAARGHGCRPAARRPRGLSGLAPGRAVRPELIVAGSVAASGRARSGPQPPGRSGSLAGGHCGVAPWTRPGAGVAPGKAVSTPTVGRAGVSAPQWRESAGTGPGPRPWREGLPLGFRKALSAARKALFETSTEAPRRPHGARVCAAGPGLLMRGPARGGTLLPLLWGARGLTRPKAAGGGGPFSAPRKASCCC